MQRVVRQRPSHHQLLRSRWALLELADVRLVLRLRVEREDAPARQAGVSQVLVQTSRGRAQSRCECGTAGVSPAVGPGANPSTVGVPALRKRATGCATHRLQASTLLLFCLRWPNGLFVCLGGLADGLFVCLFG